MNWRGGAGPGGLGQPPAILFHLKLVVKISLAVGALAAAVLLAMLTLISGDGGHTYGELIRMHSLTREHLNTAMLAAGLVLVAITAAITSLIGYYSTYRVSGPLYRFGQNLRLATYDEQAPLVALRRGDALTEQSAGVRQAVTALRAHHAALGAAAREASAALAVNDSQRYAAAVARLKELDAQAGL